MSDDENKRKETRVMRVTMDADEFEKYDQGITHSDSGLRDENGKLSALPDIEPISDEDLPYREVIKTEQVYVQPNYPSTGEMIAQIVSQKIAESIIDILSDPEVQAQIAHYGKKFWKTKLKPHISSAFEWIKGAKHTTKAEQLIKEREQSTQKIKGVEIQNNGNNSYRYVVSEAQAEQIISEAKKEAKRLSAMIFLLSNIYIKDEKSDSEYKLEQEFIKQLVSDESTKTMKILLENSYLLDDETALCFDDFLHGYIRKDNQLIPLPSHNIKNDNSKNEVKEN